MMLLLCLNVHFCLQKAYCLKTACNNFFVFHEIVPKLKQNESLKFPVFWDVWI